MVHILQLGRLEQEIDPTPILSADAHVKECDNFVVYVRRDALIEHLFRVEALLSQLLQDLVRHDLLALD